MTIIISPDRHDPDFADVRAAAMEGFREVERGEGRRPKRYSRNFAPNMAYRVELTARAVHDLNGIYSMAVRQAPYRGPRWFHRLEKSILSLSNFPERCAALPKSISQLSIVSRACFTSGMAHGKTPVAYREATQNFSVNDICHKRGTS